MSDRDIIVPLPTLLRIRATGADRARFLHNFCTNDINGLNSGCWCEAFFTSVKARIVAHGFVLADTDHHEIWMLPGDEQLLLDHLNRYIITEDVTLESVTASGTATAVIGSAADSSSAESSHNVTDRTIGELSIRSLTTTWAGRSLQLLAAQAAEPADLTDALNSERGDHQLQSGTAADFHRLRIQARFPLIGQDLSDHHLAPEALRNRTAISYTKGCYLGQEPIARLDAMGQVRRGLAAVELHEVSADADSVVDLTSYDDSQTPPIGLAVVSADSVESGSAVVRSPDGTIFSATITHPASLNGDETQ